MPAFVLLSTIRVLWLSLLHAKQSIPPAFNDGIHIMVRSLPAMSLLHSACYELCCRRESFLSLAHCFRIVIGLYGLPHASLWACKSVVIIVGMWVGMGEWEAILYGALSTIKVEKLYINTVRLLTALQNMGMWGLRLWEGMNQQKNNWNSRVTQRTKTTPKLHKIFCKKLMKLTGRISLKI